MKKYRAHFVNFYMSVIVCFLPLFLTACKMREAKDLKQLHDTMSSPEGCFTCAFFRVIYNGIGTLTNSLYETMCDYGLSLLAVGLFMWILVHVLKFITSLREPNIAQFWVLLIHTLFKCGLVAIFIGTKEKLIYLIDTLLMPIANLILATGVEILDTNWISMIPKDTYFTSGINDVPGLSADMGLMLENLVYRIHLVLNNGRVLALNLMLGSDFTNFILGIIAVCIFFLLTLFFPFYLIDGLIRMGFVLCLLPIFLVCWCFNITKKYFTTAVQIFLGAFFQIMMGCIFASLAVAVFEGFASVRSMGYIFQAVTLDDDKVVFASAERMSIHFLVFIAVAFYIYELSKKINQFTAFFTGGPDKSMMSETIGRVKAGARSLAFTVVATAAFMVGAAPVGKMATEHAQENAKHAAKGDVD